MLTLDVKSKFTELLLLAQMLALVFNNKDLKGVSWISQKLVEKFDKFSVVFRTRLWLGHSTTLIDFLCKYLAGC